MKKKKKQLNYRTKRTIEEYIKNPKSKKAAVLKVTPGLTEGSAAVQGSRIITPENISIFLAEIKIDEKGIDEVLKDALIKLFNTGYITDYKGEVTEHKDVPNIDAINKGLTQLRKLSGLDARKGITTTRKLTIIRDKSIEELKEEYKEIIS